MFDFPQVVAYIDQEDIILALRVNKKITWWLNIETTSKFIFNIFSSVSVQYWGDHHSIIPCQTLLHRCWNILLYPMISSILQISSNIIWLNHLESHHSKDSTRTNQTHRHTSKYRFREKNGKKHYMTPNYEQLFNKITIAATYPHLVPLASFWMFSHPWAVLWAARGRGLLRFQRWVAALQKLLVRPRIILLGFSGWWFS